MKPITAILIISILLLSGCGSSYEFRETGDLEDADISPDEFASLIPDYSDSLRTLSGSGRAFISEPGRSDRITVDFHSDRQASLVTFRNRIGIEGGELLVEDDSVLIYNRIDRVAEKIALHDASLSEIGSLATINLVDLFNYPVKRSAIDDVFQDNSYYVAETDDGRQITIDRETGHVLDIQMPPGSGAPYSRINYEAYEYLNGFYLPRKITIFSMDGDTRVSLLVRQLQTNLSLPALEIQIPDGIPIITL
ncbi:MAG: DUF4292 domain-containing protein [Balneolaceae bacterium]